MIGAGASRLDIVPLDTEGNRPADHVGAEGRVVGCHAGVFMGLNIENPQPHKNYQWMKNPYHRDGDYDASEAAAIYKVKGSIVKQGDPEMAVQNYMRDELNPAAVDGLVTFRELVLVRIPTEVLRQQRLENLEKNARMLRGGPERTFVDKAAQGEQNYSSQGPIRFRLSTHHSELHSDGRADEIIVPDSSVSTESVT